MRNRHVNRHAAASRLREAATGYPDIDLNEHGGEVEGFPFTSENLFSHWRALDAFEGEAYERVLAMLKSSHGSLRLAQG